MIRYGMAQWQHPQWVNWLYPASLPASQRIARYAEVFSTVEVGSTFYTRVEQSQMLRWYNVAAPTLAAQLDAKIQALSPDYQPRMWLPQVQEQQNLW